MLSLLAHNTMTHFCTSEEPVLEVSKFKLRISSLSKIRVLGQYYETCMNRYEVKYNSDEKKEKEFPK